MITVIIIPFLPHDPAVRAEAAGSVAGAGFAAGLLREGRFRPDQ
jgi:hypothetical protein